MTRPDSPNSDKIRAGVTDRWRSRWLLRLSPIALGAVILIAALKNGRILSGLVWFVTLSAIGALSPIASRFEAARRGRCDDDEDQRAAIMNTRAMSIAGIVLVIAITGCAAYTLARAESTSPYTELLAIGGISYTVALLTLRHGKS